MEYKGGIVVVSRWRCIVSAYPLGKNRENSWTNPSEVFNLAKSELLKTPANNNNIIQKHNRLCEPYLHFLATFNFQTYSLLVTFVQIASAILSKLNNSVSRLSSS